MKGRWIRPAPAHRPSSPAARSTPVAPDVQSDTDVPEDDVVVTPERLEKGAEDIRPSNVDDGRLVSSVLEMVSDAIPANGDVIAGRGLEPEQSLWIVLHLIWLFEVARSIMLLQSEWSNRLH